MQLEDLMGLKFNMLTVTSRGENDKNGKTRWWCRCDCGNEKLRLVYASSLKSGQIKSCGCTRYRANGLSRTKIYAAHKDMIQRCYNGNNQRYADYGGRNINVCEEWLDNKNGFLNFYNWSINNGYAEHLSIDRIDVNGNYEPSNCRWATAEEQQNNLRNNVIININGIEKTVAQWSKEYGIHYDTIRYRFFKMGLDGDNIFKDHRNRKHKESGEKSIYWNLRNNKWQVSISHKGKSHYVGLYKDIQDAIIARDAYIMNNLIACN